MPPQAAGDNGRSAAAEERIEHEAPGRAAGLEAGFDELLGKHREVRPAELAQRNRPDGPLVAAERMKGLVPAAVVQVDAAAVFARFGCAAANAEMPPPAA